MVASEACQGDFLLPAALYMRVVIDSLHNALSDPNLMLYLMLIIMNINQQLIYLLVNQWQQNLSVLLTLVDDLEEDDEIGTPEHCGGLVSISGLDDLGVIPFRKTFELDPF